MLRFDRSLVMNVSLCLLAGLFSFVHADSEQNASLPVFVVLRGQDMNRLDEFAACPNVSGITLYFGWSVIEPKLGVYDFSRVISSIEKANVHGKKVNLAILPGRWSPAAVLQTAHTMHWQQKDTYV